MLNEALAAYDMFEVSCIEADPALTARLLATALGQRPCPLDPVLDPAAADHRQDPVRQLEARRHRGREVGLRRKIARTQVLVD